MNHVSKLSLYRSKATESIILPGVPEGHNKYAWVSQDGRVKKIKDLDDHHLENIYRILKKSDDYMSRLGPGFIDIFDLYSENKKRLNHVEYEISIRGLILPKFELYKTINVKTVFELLQMGCHVQFPNGYILKGNPDTRFIETSMVIGEEMHDDGLRDLTETGTVEAIEDAMKYNQEEQ